VVARRLLAAAFDRGIATSGAAGVARDRPEILLSLGAALAALIFGVHPLRVESVAWVTERRDVLCGLFSLLSVVAYLTAWRRGAPARLAHGWYWAAVGCFALALLSKSTAVTLPLALLVIDVYPLGRIAFSAPGWRVSAARLVAEKLPFLALSAAITATMVIIDWRDILTPLASLGVWQRLAISAYSLAFYPSKMLMPWPLSPLYELHRPVSLLVPRYLLPALAVAVVTVAVILARRRWPALLAAWLAYVLLLLPVIGIAHNGAQVAADRYSYLPGLPLAVLAGGGFTWLLRERRRFKPSVVVAVVLVAVLAIAGWAASAWRQSKVWHDAETLWRWAVDADPDCAVCNVNLGAELVTTVSGDPARAREAEARFRRALALDPSRDFAYHGLGVALASQHRDAEAEAAFLEYTRRKPSSAIGFIDLAQLYRSRRRDDEALPFLRRAFALEPDFPGVAPTLARVLRERGEELRREGRDGEGVALLAEAAAVESSVKDHAVRRTGNRVRAVR
jgi:tetratricopeptide (TPR) repeat protein